LDAFEEEREIQKPENWKMMESLMRCGYVIWKNYEKEI